MKSKANLAVDTKEKVVHDIKVHLDEYINNLHEGDVTEKQELSLTKSLVEI